MITEWRLAHFKSIVKNETFPFRPLTVFVGPNSSGKSTVLQSILLVSQTLASQVSRRQLVLNGESVKLGTFDDVRTNSITDLSFQIGFTLNIDAGSYRSRTPTDRAIKRYFPHFLYRDIQAADVSADLSFVPTGLEEMEGDIKSRTLQARLNDAHFLTTVTPEPDSDPPSRRKLELWIRKRSQDQIKQIATNIEQSESHGAGFLEQRLLEYEIKLAPEYRFNPRRMRFAKLYDEGNVKVVAATLDHFLPTWLLGTYSAPVRAIGAALDELSDHSAETRPGALSSLQTSQDVVRRTFADAVFAVAKEHDTEPGEFLDTLLRPKRSFRTKEFETSWLTQTIARTFQSLPSAVKSRQVLEHLDPPDLLNLQSAVVTETFGSARYLGPLRDDPKPVYAISSSADPSDVGTKGQYTAAVLDLYANQLVDFIPPGKLSLPMKQMALHKAVLSWLEYFEIAESFRTIEEGKLGHRLTIRPKGGKVDLDLTNVGVGVSQVLPIVVMALVSEPGSVLLFEQPELHLHPKVQSLLADFFLSVITTGRQCIIETHSEYLINRLRLRVAEAPWGARIQDKLMIYFVERTTFASQFTKVLINEFGAIPDWPSGFFDQGPADSDRIIRAAMQKKKTRPSSRLGGGNQDA